MYMYFTYDVMRGLGISCTMTREEQVPLMYNMWSKCILRVMTLGAQVSLVLWHVRYRYLSCYDMWGAGITHVLICEVQVSLVYDMWGAGISHAMTCEVQVSLVLWHVRCMYLSCYDLWGAGSSHAMTRGVHICMYFTCNGTWATGISCCLTHWVHFWRDV